MSTATSTILELPSDWDDNETGEFLNVKNYPAGLSEIPADQYEATIAKLNMAISAKSDGR